MRKISHAGISSKKKVEYLKIEELCLDSLNPRLPEEAQGKSESDVLDILYRDFDLEELAFSMAENGYFDEEPIVTVEVRDKGNTAKRLYTVVEGNRRVATIKILLNPNIQKKLGVRMWPALSDEVKKDLSSIPAIIYSDRDEVLPYLGVRHIAGIKKWDAYPKARYVASKIEAGYSLDEIQQQIGDRQNSARKHYLCYQLAEAAKNEFDIDIKPVIANFSYIMLAIGQGSVKRFLGMTDKLRDVNLDKPVPDNKLDNLKELFSWLYGDRDRKSVLKESRDITNYLSKILLNEEAANHLREYRDIVLAYDFTDGEEKMVINNLRKANRMLESVLGIVHRHKTMDVTEEVKKCSDTINRLLEVVKEDSK